MELDLWNMHTQWQQCAFRELPLQHNAVCSQSWQSMGATNVFIKKPVVNDRNLGLDKVVAYGAVKDPAVTM